MVRKKRPVETPSSARPTESFTKEGKGGKLSFALEREMDCGCLIDVIHILYLDKDSNSIYRKYRYIAFNILICLLHLQAYDISVCIDVFIDIYRL